ncbi:MAG: ribonuclease P protein component [Pseudomonadales bacterium]|nr:ribonuclease P protein component [Pseudomonadales bacterium]
MQKAANDCPHNSVSGLFTTIHFCMAVYGFSKQQRLLKAREFQRVFDQSRLKASTRAILLLAAANPLGRPRIGFIIAKKQVRLAVQRNRIKRIIRESFRNQNNLTLNYDIIVLVRKELANLSNQDIRTEFERQLFKLVRQDNALKVTDSHA